MSGFKVTAVVCHVLYHLNCRLYNAAVSFCSITQYSYICCFLLCDLQRDESMRKIRELGSLPSDAFEKYQGLGIKQVIILCVLLSICQIAFAWQLFASLCIILLKITLSL